MNIKSGLNWRLCALALGVALTACGGSDKNEEEEPLRLNVVKVVGDSLSDSGTFASLPEGPRIASVQASAEEPHVLWVERVAKAYELAPLCPVYLFNGLTFDANTRSDCTNHAVVGARINYTINSSSIESPLSVLHQLRDAGARGFGDRDLLLVDGGGNDAADLVGAYLSAPANQHDAAYAQLLGTLLPPGTITEYMSADGGPEALGGLYMQTLADRLSDAVKTQALARGAKHVVIANIPVITHTPRFQAVLAEIAAAADEAASARAEALFKSWVNAFNQRLTTHFSDEPRVKIFDLASRFTDQISNPGKYGLDNVTLPVCGAEGFALVPYRPLAECTAAALSATPPPPGAPAGANWWQRFMFADGFHPTPYGHQLFGEQVIDLLDEAGWL